MKTISQIAKECKLTYEKTYRTMIVNKIIPTNINGFCFLDTHQEELLHYCLYRIGVLEEVIFESKINHVETKEEKQEAFRKFKKETYGKIN